METGIDLSRDEILTLLDRVASLELEVARLKNSLSDIVHAEPAKPREGMIALADGSMWDPGFGKGLYQYLDSEWVPLNGIDAWSDLTLLNSWVNFGSGYANAGYTKDNGGFVHLRGAIKDGTFADNTVLFNLPAGYQPAASLLFIVTNTLGDNCKLLVGADVRIFDASSNTQVTLDGVVFSVR